MNPSIDPSTPTDESPEINLGRRQLLKALVAGSGVVAASSVLPGQWTQPVIEAGLLPPHAQGSPVPGPFTVAPITLPFGGIITTCPSETITVVSATLSPIPPAGTVVTFTVGNIVPNDPAFPPSFSQTTGTASTNAAGIATFTTPIDVSGDTGDAFDIIFSSTGSPDVTVSFSVDNSMC